MEQYNFFSYQIFLPFVSLILALVALVVILNIVWRVQKHLLTVVKLCAASLIIFIVRKVLFIMGLGNNPWWSVVLQIFDAATIFPFMVATIQMSKIIRQLDGETPLKQNEINSKKI